MSTWRRRYGQAYCERQADAEHWERERLRIFYHEAAHAAAHTLLGWATVDRVSVIGEAADVDGKCFYSWRNDPPDYTARLIASLAGAVSDQMFFGVEEIAPGDLAHAREFAEQLAPDDVDGTIEAARKVAGDLIYQNAKAVEQLALCLRESGGELDGDQAVRILHRAGLQRANVRGPMPDYSPAEIMHRRLNAPPPAYSFERRNGRLVPAANPDPARAVSPVEYRCDGGFA